MLWYLVLLGASFVSTQQQQVTTTECGKSVGCFQYPPSCTSSSNCDALVTYKFDANSIAYDITISTKAKWIGFAQVDVLNTEALMTNITGQICFNNNSIAKLANLRATRNGMPTFNSTLADLTVLQTYILPTGELVCKYRRSAVPSAGSEKFLFSLNQPIHVVYAWGTALSNGYPANHGFGNYSHTANKVDLRTLQSTVPPTLQSTVVPSTAAPTTMTSVINLSQCGRKFNCFVHPQGCQSTSICEAVATFQYNLTTKKILFEILTKHSWIGFAQKPIDSQDAMVSLRGQYCAKAPVVSAGNFNGNSLTSNGNPSWVDKVDGVTMTLQRLNNDGSISCKYERDVIPSTASGNNLYDLNRTLLAVIAYGTSLSGVRPAYHGVGSYAVSSTAIDFLKVQDVTGSPPSFSKAVKAHGTLMILAWILFATCGIFMSRYMKPKLSKLKIMGVGAWFRLHQLFMSLCLICFITAFIVILVEKKGWNTNNAGRHHWTGLFAVIAGLIQPFMAIFRCAPDANNRFIFNWMHRLVGILGWLLAGLAVIFGLDLVDRSHDNPYIIAFIVITIVLFILLDIILLVKQPRAASSDIPDQVKDVTIQNVGSPSTHSNSNIHYVFMSIVFAFATAIAIDEIYVVATL